MVSKSPKAAHATHTGSTPVPASGFDRFFLITKRGSTVRREVIGGLVTFFTMAYIIALNPVIIGTVPDVNGNLVSGLPAMDAAGQKIAANIGTTMGMVAAVTALIAGLMTILMGVYGKFPVALATGLGLNALLAGSIVRTMTWPQAMGLIVWEGILILVLVLTGVRKAIFNAVPRSLRASISVGIGLFITLIGLVDGGIVRRPADPFAPPVELGINGSLAGWPMAIFIIGLILVTVLYLKKVPGSLLIAIAATTILAMIVQAIAKIPSIMTSPTGWKLNIPAWPSSFAPPNFSLIGRVDLIGSFLDHGHFRFGIFLGTLLLVFALLLSDFFDTMGTIVAIGAEGGLLDAKGNPPHTGRILLVDSLAAIAGGAGSVSSNTTYIESASGVGAGARTGFASVITGAAFLVAVFLSPFVNMVPSEASTPVLVFVGFLMMSQVREIDWEDAEEGLPAFLGIALMPFTYSITVGIGAAFVFYVLLKLVGGKAKAVHPLLYVVAALFVVYFVQGLIAGALK